jgi:hypothetical protein
MKILKPIIILIVFTFYFNTLFSQSSYNVNSDPLRFVTARKTHKVGTDGKTANNITLYTNVITVGTQVIDCIVTTKTINNGSFIGTNSLQPSFDFDNVSSTLSGNSDAFFSPLFSWNSGGGSCEFEFQFILGGSYNNSTNKGTNVILQNVFVNTYDIDGNGSSENGSNQFNEFGGFSSSQYQTTTGARIQATYNTSTSLTKFRSTTGINENNVTADKHRIRVFYNNLSLFRFVVGAEESGSAYYFIDFSQGPSWTNTPSITYPPSLDLNSNTSAPGLDNIASIDACNTHANFTTGNTNLSGATSIDNIYVQFEASQIKDGNSEILNINGATSGANIPLNFSNGASISQVTHNSITYNVTASVVSGISKLTFARTSGNITLAEAESFIDALRYVNTDCGTLTVGERDFDVSVRSGSFESEPATFQLDIIAPLPIELVNFDIFKIDNTNSKLTWTTMNELHNHYFEIFKSYNDKTWESIGKVLGAGTSNSINNYEFIDENFKNSSYYKLRQVDLDGHETFSNILFLENNNLSIFNIYPNPSNGSIQIVASEEMEFVITDLTGKVVAEDKTQNTPYSIELSKGIYFIKLANDLNTFVQKIIIQ